MLLSICIPSYNRLDKLQKLLNSISASKSNDFDVFVVDNCSDFNLNDIKISDHRIKLVRRKEQVNGIVSWRSSLEYGDGKFIMLCLDKDFIFGEYLDRFLSELKTKNVKCGFCVPNSSDLENGLEINNQDISKSIYRCIQPSGYFVEKDVLEQDAKENDIYNESSLFYANPFGLDLAYARALTYGDEAIYKGKLIGNETLEDAAKTKSFTYSAKNNNIYFFPENRIKQLNIFIENASKLTLLKADFNNIIKRLFSKTLLEVTIGLRSVMKNKEICEHHRLETRNVSLKEMIHYGNSLSKWFLKKDIKGISKLKKNLYVLRGWVYLLAKSIMI